MPRVLMVCARHPSPPTRGDQLRVYHLARALSQKAEVRLACFDSHDSEPIEGVPICTTARGPVSAVAGNAAAPDPRLPLQTRLYLDRGMRQLLGAEIASFQPDVLHVTLARMGPYAKAADPRTHVHLDFVDALSLNMGSRAQASHQPLRSALAVEAGLMGRYEARLAATVDSCSVVSERDRTASPGLNRAAVVPNGVDTTAFPFADPASRPERLLFFGNLGYFHNVWPARTVALEVLPLVRRRLPAAELRIAGARPAAAVKELAPLDGVDLRVDVPDMGAELQACAVAVLPMASGSGMKNKVLEAFATGTPVVTNAAGIAGIDGAVEGQHYLAAESARGLAEACIRLIEEPAERTRLAVQAAELVRDGFSWDRRAEQLLDLYGGTRP
jgi:glycosyltransferase involved in cell wall biosynthesis